LADNPFRLDGKRVLVTGAGRGIGAGLARGLAEAGADLVLLARSEADLRETAAGLADTSRKVDIFPCDLLKTREITERFGEIVSQFGPIDILVNNAGMSRRGAAVDLASDDWQTVFDLNVTAMFELSRAYAKARIAQGGGGKVVNIGSLMCSATRPNVSAYTASKGAVLLLTKSLAVEWAEHRILVNAIGPGYIETPLTQALVDDPKFSAWVKESCPLARWGKPSDLAGPVVFLASAASDFVTGQILYVDGGWLSRL
jgi:gluconate 5-dehydrogenase